MLIIACDGNQQGNPSALTGHHDFAEKTQPETNELSILALDGSFAPDELIIPDASRMRLLITNSGDVVHTFTVDRLGLDEVLKPGQSSTLRFKSPSRSVPFYCKIHPVMSGMLYRH